MDIMKVSTKATNTQSVCQPKFVSKTIHHHRRFRTMDFKFLKMDARTTSPASNFFNYSPEKLAIHPQQLKSFPSRKNPTEFTKPPQSPTVLRLQIPHQTSPKLHNRTPKNTTQKWVPASNCVPCAKNFPLHSTNFRSSKKKLKIKWNTRIWKRRRWRWFLLEAGGGLIFAATAPAALHATSLLSKFLLAP